MQMSAVYSYTYARKVTSPELGQVAAVSYDPEQQLGESAMRVEHVSDETPCSQP